MPKLYLKELQQEDLKYIKEWLKDPLTMEYNKNGNLTIKGYNNNDGTITKTDEEMLNWFHNWYNKTPDKYYALIYIEGINEPIGEVHYQLIDEVHQMGILIKHEYRIKVIVLKL